jgi:dihydroorotate dehydrogenase
MYSAVFAVAKRLDPELTHSLGMAIIRLAGSPLLRRVLRKKTRPSSSLAVGTLGLNFESPVGLAAGFDKNAEAILGMHALGFGHVEVGTVTQHPQKGNPKPRLFRLPADQALINRMGFNNDGAKSMARRLRSLRAKHKDLPVIGVNIGKSRITPLEDAVADYVASTHELRDLADYLVVNVSSPNTPGLRGLQDEKALRPLLKAVLTAAQDTPVLVKIAPDLSDNAVVQVCRLAVKLGLAGIIATNTTISREGLLSDGSQLSAMGEGGLSGQPLATRAMEVLRLIRHTVPRDFCVISVGGIFTGADVAARLAAGATLVQAYTGFVYRGPLFAHHLTRELKGASRKN